MKTHARPYLAAAVVFGFLGVLAALLFLPVPDATNNALMIMLGGLSAEFARVLAYYFGSSQGSHEKQGILDRILPGGEPPEGGVEPID